MNRSKLNSDLQTSVGPDGVPLDWHNVITAKGLSKNEKLKLYVVRLSIGGKQFFLGNAYSQAVGARLYDLALWKFAGKLTRAHTPNDPTNFEVIKQEHVDLEAPRFDSIYAKIPFLCSEDEHLSEEELRASRVSGGKLIQPRVEFTGHIYATTLGRLKRLRLALTEEFEHVNAWHHKLIPSLTKLPALSSDFSKLEQQLAEAAKATALLESAMESQQEYYHRMNNYEKI